MKSSAETERVKRRRKGEEGKKREEEERREKRKNGREERERVSAAPKNEAVIGKVANVDGSDHPKQTSPSNKEPHHPPFNSTVAEPVPVEAALNHYRT